VSALAVEARGLVKRSGEKTAVDGIDLDVPIGGWFRFLGPNGAAKATSRELPAVSCAVGS
jgi:ABC-type multidrug transport system ATPase subunit